jgi:hypothetical protein
MTGFRFAMPRRGVVLATLGVLVLLAAAGVTGYFVFRDTGKTVTIAGDQIGCVYTSAAKGHRFVKAIAPAASAHIGKTDELVLLPNGDQLYTISTSGNRTQEAPGRLLAFTRGQTAVWVEGVLKFRFNTGGAKACQWYSKYGLQSTSYGNLGFAATSGIAQEKTGWYRFLAEAHGTTLQQVVHDGSSAWTWQQLAYGADPTLKVKPTTEPVSVGYGKHIGALLTKYLSLNLGSSYFCGVQPGITGAGETAGCPPMYFQITSVYPRDKTLAEEHDKLKQLDAQLARQRQAAKLRDLNRNTLVKEAEAQRKVIEAQIVNARLAAQNDVRIQKCLILARVGLDCDGKKPTIVVPGVTTK